MRRSKFWSNERGTSYALSAVVVLPAFLLFVVMVIDLCYLMTTRFGVQRAALEAARSAAVWEGLTPSDVVQERAHRSASWTMASYVGNSDRELSTSTTSDATGQARLYATSVCLMTGLSEHEMLMQRRYVAAANRTKVAIESSGDLVRATVKYRARLISPLGSRYFLGNTHGDFLLQASVTLPRELPEGPGLGIGYDPQVSLGEARP